MQRSVRPSFWALVLTFATTLLALAVLPAGAQPEPALDTVLAQGNPPLTERIVEQFADFQAWLLEVSVTKDMRAYQRAELVQSWTDPQEAKSLLGYVSLTTWLTQASPDEREFFRVDVQENMLTSMRAHKSDPTAHFLVAAYEAGHPPIAAGNPPLTDNMVSHYVAFLGWLLEIPISQAFADNQRARLVQGWKNPKDVQIALLMLKWQLEIARLKYGTPEREYARTIISPY